MLVVAGALLVAFVPRRKSILQLAALTAAVLIGFELVLTHWFYLYIPWFFPFVAFAVLSTSCPRPAGSLRSRPRWRPRCSSSPGACSTPAGTTTDEIVDIPVYETYGNAIESGAVPYRDIRPEYPPGALPAFAVPALLSDDQEGFRDVFEWLMAACGVAAVLLAAVALAGLGASRARTAAALALVAGFPLLLGSVVLTRFDLYPAALVAGALAALVHRRDRLGFGVLGAAIAVKLYPAVLAPARRRLRLAPPRAPRGARLPGRGGRCRRARVPPLPARGARRRRPQHRPPALAPAPDREPRRGALPRRPPPARARRRDALGARLAEPARDGDGSRRGAAQPRPARRARLDLAAPAGHPPRSSCAGAPRRSSPSSRSGRCCRRSS